MNYPKAFIFDLDGVITDTAEYHYLAWKKLADEIGITFDREFNEQLKGINRMDSLEQILTLDTTKAEMSMHEKERLAQLKNEYYLSLINSLDSTSILPGITELLQQIKKHSIKIALGSASKNATTILQQLGLIQFFDYIVDASSVKNGKPHPETFTTAADYLKAPYKECIGIEDAAAGVQAINSAGMFSVGVGSLDILSEANYNVSTTSGLKFEQIITHYQEMKRDEPK